MTWLLCGVAYAVGVLSLFLLGAAIHWLRVSQGLSFMGVGGSCDHLGVNSSGLPLKPGELDVRRRFWYAIGVHEGLLRRLDCDGFRAMIGNDSE